MTSLSLNPLGAATTTNTTPYQLFTPTRIVGAIIFLAAAFFLWMSSRGERSDPTDTSSNSKTPAQAAAAPAISTEEQKVLQATLESIMTSAIHDDITFYSKAKYERNIRREFSIKVVSTLLDKQGQQEEITGILDKLAINVEGKSIQELSILLLNQIYGETSAADYKDYDFQITIKPKPVINYGRGGGSGGGGGGGSGWCEALPKVN
ncbi:hypothetical protein K0U07_01805 [bacterium]|nr:hypothetical protein [bacterium]